MKTFGILVSSVAMLAINLCACGNQNDSRTAGRRISSFELSSVSQKELEARTTVDSAILVNIVIDNHPFRIELKRSNFAERQQSYLGERGEYFYDVQARCLGSACERFALGITVHFSGGTLEEVAGYRQVFAKVDLASNALSEVISRAGDGTPASVEEYVAGNLK